MRIPAPGTLSGPIAGQAERGGVSRLRAAYGAVVLAGCALTFVVIAWGGMVRATGAGLACPDWPLCNGSAVPEPTKLVLIEWGHRLIAGILGFVIFFTTFGAWRWHRHDRGVLIPATLASVFVVIQIILGAITVTADLSPQIVSAHLGTSMLVLAMMLMTAAGLWRRPRLHRSASLRALPLVALFGAAMTYGLLLTGSYVVGSGAGAACRAWPECDGLPGAGDLVQVHMFHRTAVLLVGAVVAYTAWRAFQARRRLPALWNVAAAAVGIYAAQALIGAGNIWFGLVPAVQVAHLAAAAAMWSAMVLLATLAWRASAVEG
jgi:heme A synthase